MKLGYKRTQFFQKTETNLFEVTFGFARSLIPLVSGIDVFDIVVEPNGVGLRRHLPFGGTEEDTDVQGIDFRDARRNGSRLEGMVDGGEKNGFASNVNDGAAAGQVSDDFVFLCVEREREEETSAELEEKDSQSVLTISYFINRLARKAH